MKNTPFILLILGVAFVWLGLTGRLGAVLAAIFQPDRLMDNGGAPSGGWISKGTPPADSPAVGGGGYQTPPPNAMIGGAI